MIEGLSLWHVTPVHLGSEFFDPVTSALDANETLYNLVNDKTLLINKNEYSSKDYACIKRMKSFFNKIRDEINEGRSTAKFCEKFPEINGCIAKFQLTASIFCYIIYNGTAVFVEYGDNIKTEEEKYFSLPCFYERQIYEDDYCMLKEVSPRKKLVYDFVQLLWKAMGKNCKSYSSSKAFRNNGISYTLCITMIDIPTLASNKIDETLVKNINAILDTSPFNNILDKKQWELIKTRVDEYTTENPRIKELSENLIFADNWSGVVIAGDLKNNQKCITWFMEFEIFLQSNWLLFDAYCENIIREEMSLIELQKTLSHVEFLMSSLNNDISSNMEQSRHVMRNALIDSSDISVIYSRLHGMLTNKLKLQTIEEDKKKSKYSLLADMALVFIAAMEIYGAVISLLEMDFGKNEIIAMGIILFIVAICIWAMIKGRK